MEQNTVGTVLHYYRKKYKLSAMQICGGICSPSNFYLLEDGVREMDSLTCQMLLSRIGKEVNQFEMMLSAKDYKQWQLRQKIEQCVAHKLSELDKQSELEQLLKQYRNIMPKEQKVHQQFCFVYEILLLEKRGASLPLLLEKTMEALLCTRGDAPGALYSKQELALICCRSRYLAVEDFSFAKKKLRHILQYVKLFAKGRQRETYEVPVYEALIQITMQRMLWEETIVYLEKTIEIYQETAHFFPLAMLYEKKADCLKKQYEGSRQWNEKRKEAQQCMAMAQAIYLVCTKEESPLHRYVGREEEPCRVIVPVTSFDYPELPAI